MENLSKPADVSHITPETLDAMHKLTQQYRDIYGTFVMPASKALAVQGEIEEIKSMGPLARLKKLKNTRACGGDWKQEYEHIRQIVDPYDAMTDTQVFGAEIPWDFWRD